MPLDREVLVVAEHARPSAARSGRMRRSRRRCANTGRVAQHQPDLVRDLARAAPAIRSAVRERRRERLLAEHGAARARPRPRPPRGAPPSRCRSTPRRRRRASSSSVAVARGAVIGSAMRSARSRSGSKVAVTPASTSRRRTSWRERERVDRADVAAADEPDPQHHALLRSLAVGSRRPGPRLHGAGAEALASTLVDRRTRRPRAPDGGRVASRGRARRSGVVVELEPALHRDRRPRAAARTRRAAGCRRRGRPPGAARRAVAADLRARGRSASGSVCARVIVRKSRVPQLQLHGARRPRRGPRSRVATASAMRSASRSSPARSVRSSRNVSSCPIDFSSRSGSTGAVVAVPRQRVQVGAVRAARAWP